MLAAEVMAELATLGATLRLTNLESGAPGLSASPRSAITADLSTRIRKNRPELLALAAFLPVGPEETPEQHAARYALLDRWYARYDRPDPAAGYAPPTVQHSLCRDISPSPDPRPTPEPPNAPEARPSRPDTSADAAASTGPVHSEIGI